MKICEHCGTSVPTKAKFCLNCGERFLELAKELDVESRPARRRKKDGAERVFSERNDAESSELAAPKSRELTLVRKPSAEENKIGDAASNFAASFWNLFVAGARLILRLLQPLFAWLLTALRETIYKALAPSSTWDARKAPNFVYWGVLEYLVWTLPFSVVGIVFAALANDARTNEEYDLARKRAEIAKNWLLFDLGAGIVVCVFKNLVKL